jgi:uncharacterized protein YbjQ (UPF0145 family)
VEITPMATIPGYQVTTYLGNMNLFIIRETSSVREFGGISGFMHKFVSEVLALMRAHVAALGGNALLAFSMNQCVLLDNPNRNQAQCLINITGDAVCVEQDRTGSDAPKIPTGAPIRMSSSHSPKPVSRKTDGDGGDGGGVNGAAAEETGHSDSKFVNFGINSNY